jgi:prepilin-type N-terminal cleavage/methylation domain-containing protein
MKTESGFTLVEVIVTIAVLGITTASISSVFVGIQNVQRQNSYLDSANRAAARQIESLRNDSYSTLVAGSTIDFTDQLPAVLPSATGTALISSPSTDLRRVDATVTYESQGRIRTVTQSSMIGEIGITQ